MVCILEDSLRRNIGCECLEFRAAGSHSSRSRSYHQLRISFIYKFSPPSDATANATLFPDWQTRSYPSSALCHRETRHPLRSFNINCLLPFFQKPLGSSGGCGNAGIAFNWPRFKNANALYCYPQARDVSVDNDDTVSLLLPKVAPKFEIFGRNDVPSAQNFSLAAAPSYVRSSGMENPASRFRGETR